MMTIVGMLMTIAMVAECLVKSGAGRARQRKREEHREPAAAARLCFK